MSKNIRRLKQRSPTHLHGSQGGPLWLIAKRLDTTVATLVKLNKIGPRDLLGIGQQIKLPNIAGIPTLTDSPPNKIRKIRYRVRPAAARSAESPQRLVARG